MNAGIVIPAGGSYVPSAYVSVRMLRHVGCALPIEIFYLGADELPGWHRAALEPYNVRFVDAEKFGMRIRGGWELKPFAVLHSSFQHVLFLDADCYPIRDPSFLLESNEYKKTGAIFWPDPPQFAPKRDFWKALAIRGDGYRPIESGQLVVDKARCWRALNLVTWMCQHSDFYFTLGHGDKDLWGAAWRYLHQPYSMPERDYAAERPAMIQYGPDGDPLFVHRASGKFSLTDTNQEATRRQTNFLNERLPMEREAWAFLDELRNFRDTQQPLADPIPAGTASHILHGAVALTKSIVGVGRPLEIVIGRRSAVCEACDQLKPDPRTMGLTKHCAVCGCQWPAKLKVASESCPHGHWPRSGEKKAIVQLGRFGDILLLLPAMKWLADMGTEVTHVVHERYASLTANISWLKQFVYSGYAVDPFGAADAARAAGLQPILTMVGNNDPMPLPADKTFAHVQWERAGVPLYQLDRLPLILDNRDAAAEQSVIDGAELDGRPLVLFNATHHVAEGRPAPFVKGPQLLSRICEDFPDHQVLDLNMIRAPRLVDLMGLYDRAKLIVSTDTATLHMSAAIRSDGTPTPAIGIVLDGSYHRAPRRQHWIAEFSYKDADPGAISHAIAEHCLHSSRSHR